MGSRRWNEAQDRLIRRYWQVVETRQIAELLDRARQEVSIRAWELGCMGKRPDGHLSEAEVREVTRLAELGESWTEIGRRVGIDRHHLARMAAERGIRINSDGPRYGQYHRVGLDKQRATLGIRTSGELRQWSFRQYAKRRGWPEDLGPRQVQILDALYEHGPQGRRDLAGRIGMPWKGTRKSLTAARLDGGSYLADLIRRGLVLRLPRQLVGADGNRCDLYFIHPEIVRGKPETWPVVRTTPSASPASTSRRSRKS